jgi:hypothetical protein
VTVVLRARARLLYAPCTDSGQNCANDIYVSLPGVTPSASVTWFQAQEACANAGKRLPTNAEWQVGANGTPDPGEFGDNGTTDCNSSTLAVAPTGSRSSCVSARGAFDMVGNLAEWVADWVPHLDDCPDWPFGLTDHDLMCLSGARSGFGAAMTLLRRNLALTPEQRLRQLMQLQRFADELRRAGRRARSAG